MFQTFFCTTSSSRVTHKNVIFLGGATRAIIQRAAQLGGGNFQKLFRTPNLSHFHKVPLSTQKCFSEIFFVSLDWIVVNLC